MTLVRTIPTTTYEDPDLLEDSLPYPVYSCRGTLAHKLICCVEIEWHGKGRMPKERRFCNRCMKGKWDPRLQFEREAVLIEVLHGLTALDLY